MLSNRLRLVQGASASFSIDLIDEAGEPLSAEDLATSVAGLVVRADPEGVDVLSFTSPDASHVALDPEASTLSIGFTSADTAALGVGAYFYRVKLTHADGDIEFPVEWAPLVVGLGGAADPTPPTFENVVKLDHDYPQPGDLVYATPGGSPIAEAQVRVYAKADYDAGKLGSPIGITRTDARGRWETGILVAPGYEYMIQFFKPNEYGPDVTQVTALS